ncbi:MAG TPA: YXWGXW repeat-containing protein [Steroidobacteraceae bacterium]|nr:YXWGXW repeat-containing protein [Steroidobacteraceae bacterium]
MKVPTRTDRAERRSAGARKILGRLAVSAVAATMLLGAALPAVSAVGIDIEIAPPAPRIVEVPPPRAGFVWAPGYYRWDGHQHVWVEGRWLRERRGFHWVPEHWNERHGRYHFEPGHWARG